MMKEKLDFQINALLTENQYKKFERYCDYKCMPKSQMVRWLILCAMRDFEKEEK